jgi:urate oxidase
MVRFPKYNLARRIADHRAAFDKVLPINKTVFTKGYFYSVQQYFFHFAIDEWPVVLLTCCFVVGSCTLSFII